MAPITRAGIILVFGAIISMGVSWMAQLEANARLKLEIGQVHERFEAMSREHERALAAAGEALAARDEIRELYRKRSRDAENAIEACGDFGGQLLPEPLRLFLENACASPAASEPDGGHSPAATN